MEAGIDLAAGLRARHGLRTPDAIQIATALRHKAETFITNDERLASVKEIKVTIPRRRK
jgi:predicted nucleic acid-binding protein